MKGMKRLLVILLFLFLGLQAAFATHYRAGELTYRVLGYLHFEVTVTTYTTDITGLPDTNAVPIDWGDGTTSYAPRVNGGGNGVSLGGNIKVNVFVTDHQYAGPQAYYIISLTDPNRINGIKNINGGYSDGIAFFIEDTLKIFDPSFNGYNNSPILLYPPIDYGNVNDTFYHNPGAYDPDGDSLSFELVPCKSGAGAIVPGWQSPDEAVLPGIDNKITINPRTGEVIWATPKAAFTYNIAILVREYRGGVQIGTVLRDMQIIIKQENNHPPRIMPIRDTCVVAGSLLTIPVTANDPDSGQTVSLSAIGGPFYLTNSPATFSSTSGIDTASGIFSWQTNCKHIRKEFYEVIFKAQDNYQQGPLVDLWTWIIKVIGPGPENLQAQATGNVVNLTWDSPYACDSTQSGGTFIGFSVWRREGPNPFTPDTCNPGLAGHGYTLIKDLTKDYFYNDSSVVRGKVYCYRIQAEFALKSDFGILYNQVPSLPSNEACANLKLDIPIITKASVNATDVTHGRIRVEWQKPITNSLNLDTVQHPGPYRFVVFRAQGFTGAAGGTQIADFTTPFIGSFVDTVVIDTGLNTVDNPYNYLVDFYSNGTKLGSTEDASSVYLIVRRNDRSNDLSWQASVPWLNDTFQVQRLNPISGLFDSIATTTDSAYTDTGLINDSLYCYKILSIGRYTVPGLVDPILNRSEEACQRPHDTIPPCPPSLVVENPCTGLSADTGTNCSTGANQLKNILTWTPQNTDSCNSGGTRKYNIYFKDPATQLYTLVDSILSPTDTTFQHSNDNSLAGCYKVTAIDTVGNESDYSNEVCVDNCPCYQLPNVFTPNGDGHNDMYTPILPFRFIAKVEMKIYNRWGDLVYSTEAPIINWDGNDTRTHKPLPEDTYYYTCKVYEIRVDGIVQNQNVLSGFIHLIRGNGGSNK